MQSGPNGDGDGTRHMVEGMTDQGDIAGKPTSASRTTLSHIMTSHDTNLLGTVHGGVIM